jgi:hypothetical protein
MVRIPIACTLVEEDRADRVEEWRAFLGSSVREVERAPTVARLRLVQGDDVLVAAADLAGRERACCAFFTFTLRIDGPETTWLEVEVPDDAVPVLDGLLALADG